MLSLSGIETYLIASVITACLAFTIYLIEINLQAKLLVITLAVIFCMPGFILVRFIKGKSNLGKREEMSYLRQIVVVLMILLGTYIVVASLAKTEKKELIAPEELKRAERKATRSRPLYKTVFSSLVKKWENPIEDRLHAF